MLFPQGSLDDVEEGTHLLAILDEHWEEFLREEDCTVRDRLNRWRVPLDAGGGKDEDAYFQTSIRQVRASFICVLLPLSSTQILNGRPSPLSAARLMNKWLILLVGCVLLSYCKGGISFALLCRGVKLIANSDRP